jgi:hypothetical protein
LSESARAAELLNPLVSKHLMRRSAAFGNRDARLGVVPPVGGTIHPSYSGH